ncbi:MAG: formate dehydrogenase subunit gamma [Steroidobacteraceae bacterium]
MSNPTARRVIPIRVEGPAELSEEERAAAVGACLRLQEVPGALLPVLHAVQEALGFVGKEAQALIARRLNLSLAEVHGVVSFYHYFRTARGGRHVVHLCRAEACQALGAVRLEGHAKRSLGIDYHGTTADGAISLAAVYCLGNCALGPSLMIDEELHGRVTAERFDELMGPLRAAAAGER